MTTAPPWSLAAAARLLVAVAACWSRAVVVPAAVAEVAAATTTAATTTAATTTAAATTAAGQGELDLVLVHTNDMHSRFDETDAYCNECREDDAARGLCYGGFARVAQYVEDARREAAARDVPSLFLVAGDTFQGTAYYSFFKWHPVVEFINQLRPDAMTLGNHEFDDGVDNLVSYLNGIKNIPTVISNLNTTAEPRLNDFLLSSYIFTLKNTKVGIVGYLTTDTPYLSDVGRVEFFDEIESVKKEVKKLRDSGVKIIIGLGHSGIEKDKEIAREVEDIDLIVGGHSHTFLYSGNPPSNEKPYGSYPFYVTNRNNKAVPILQAYAYTKYIGKVDLKFDSDGELISINGSPILLNHEKQQDPAMMTVVNQWKPNVISKTNITVGRTAVELINVCHFYECNIGNLIADSYVYYNVLTKKVYDKYWSDAPIGIIQSGGIRTSINETDHDGLFTVGQLLNVMPFMNSLVKITISGSSLLEAFEHSVYEYNEKSGGRNLLQVSGIKVEYDLTRSPGNRVTSLSVRCGRCSIPRFEPLVLNNNYTIVTNNYLANGGDKFDSFKKILKKNEVMSIGDVDSVIVYVNASSPVTTGIEGRINIKNTADDEKSMAFSINTQNSQLAILISTFLFLIFNILS